MDSSAAIHYDNEPESQVARADQVPTTESDLKYRDEEKNLVTVFLRSARGRSALKLLEQHIHAEYKGAWEASEQYRKNWTDDWKVCIGELPDKTGVFKDCANASVPTGLENSSRIWLRLHGEIFDDYKNVCTVAPIKKDDAAAEAMTKHTNWQLRTQIPDFKTQMHRACAAFVHVGDFPVHSYYDDELEQNRHEVLTPDEFVMPWATKTTMPDYSDLPWLGKICLMHVHQLEAKIGDWENIEEILQDYRPTFDDDPEQPAAEEVTKMHGQEQNDATKHAPFKILWWEGWLNLPNQKKQRFVKAHMHIESMRLLALTIHEEPHWQELARYEQQQGELEQYEALRAQYETRRREAEDSFGQADELVDTMADSELASPDVALEGMQQVEQAREQAMSAMDELEPEPPPWLEEDGRVRPPSRTRPIHMFTHFSCLEALVGNRGLGYGLIQADLQRAINTLVSQFIDSATFANIGAFAATKNFESRGKLKFSPGAVNVLEGMDVDDIRKALMPLSTGQANPQLMELANLLMEQARSSMQASEILSGEPGKSGETYKGVAARIEQATKQLSVVGRKFGDGLRQVLKNNARLNAIFLPEDEVIRIADLEGAPEVRVSARMYQESYDFEIRADMRFATNVQRVMEADELLEMTMKLTMPGAPMQGNLAIQYEAISGAYLARRRPDMVALMGPRPPAAMVFGPPPPPLLPQGAPGGGPPPGGGGPPQGGPPGGQQ